MTKLICIPVFARKTKSSVGKQVVKMIEESNICSDSPLLKKILLQNINACLVVIETSGSGSLQVLCVAAPYLVKILSKTHPKLGEILSDDRIQSCKEFLKEVDLEPLLDAARATTVFVRNAAAKLYPIVCVKLGRSAMLLAESTYKSAVRLLCSGLLHCVRFVLEDLPPLVRSLGDRNLALAKCIAGNAPRLSLAAAKGFLTFGLCLRRILIASLKAVKKLLIFCRRSLESVPYHEILLRVSENLYLTLRSFARLLTNSDYYKIGTTTWEYCLSAVSICVFTVLPFLWEKYSQLIKIGAPLLRKAILSVIHSPSIDKLFAEENIKVLFNLFHKSKYLVVSLIKNLNLYTSSMYNAILGTVSNATSILEVLFMYVFKFLSLISKTVIKNIVFLVKNRKPMTENLTNTLICHRKTFDTLLLLGLKFLKAIRITSKLIAKCICSGTFACISRTKTILLSAQKEVKPHIYPMMRELTLTVTYSFEEVSAKSVNGVNRVVPSVLSALATVAPPTISVTREIVSSLTDCSLTIHPDLLRAAVHIRPEVHRALRVLAEDSGKACVEVSSTSFRALLEVKGVTECMVVNSPHVVRAAEEVATTTSRAAVQVARAGAMARSRVLRDFRSAVTHASSSFRSAEVEIFTTLDEIRLELQELVTADGETLKMWQLVCGKSSLCKKRLRENSRLSDLFVFLYELFDKIANPAVFSLASKALYVISKNIVLILSYVVKSSFHNPIIKSLYSQVLKSSKLYISKALKMSDAYISTLCIKALSCICEILIPVIWNAFNHEAFVLWQKFCDFSLKTWMLVETLLPQIWNSTNEHIPIFWGNIKKLSPMIWKQICSASPIMWSAIRTTTPIVWCFYRDQVRSGWDLHLQMCGATWDVFVSMSSASWLLAVDHLPNVWLNVCENSKVSWEIFCIGMENSWEAVTSTSFSSWKTLLQIISKSWNTAIRPLSKATCYNAVFVLSKSIEIPLRTINDIKIINDELSSKYLVPFVYSKIHTKSAFVESPENELSFNEKMGVSEIGYKHKLFDNAVSVIGISCRLAGSCSNLLLSRPLLKSWMTISKIYSMPINSTCNIAQQLLKLM